MQDLLNRTEEFFLTLPNSPYHSFFANPSSQASFVPPKLSSPPGTVSTMGTYAATTGPVDEDMLFSSEAYGVSQEEEEEAAVEEEEDKEEEEEEEEGELSFESFVLKTPPPPPARELAGDLSTKTVREMRSIHLWREGVEGWGFSAEEQW